MRIGISIQSAYRVSTPEKARFMVERAEAARQADLDSLLSVIIMSPITLTTRTRLS